MNSKTETGHEILRILYEDHFGDQENNISKSEIAERIDGVDQAKVNRIIGNLGHADLLSSVSDPPKISTDGIDLVLSMEERDARQEERDARKEERDARREERKNQRKHREKIQTSNSTIQLLTLALVLTGGLQAVTGNLGGSSDSNALCISLIGSGAIILIVIIGLILIHD